MSDAVPILPTLADPPRRDRRIVATAAASVLLHLLVLALDPVAAGAATWRTSRPNRNRSMLDLVPPQRYAELAQAADLKSAPKPPSKSRCPYRCPASWCLTRCSTHPLNRRPRPKPRRRPKLHLQQQCRRTLHHFPAPHRWPPRPPPRQRHRRRRSSSRVGPAEASSDASASEPARRRLGLGIGAIVRSLRRSILRLRHPKRLRARHRILAADRRYAPDASRQICEQPSARAGRQRDAAC